MDWAGWAVFGLVAATGLTEVMIAAQVAGRTPLDLPHMLGTITTEDPDRRSRISARCPSVASRWLFTIVRWGRQRTSPDPGNTKRRREPERPNRLSALDVHCGQV
jgi:hypothetical protein